MTFYVAQTNYVCQTMYARRHCMCAKLCMKDDILCVLNYVCKMTFYVAQTRSQNCHLMKIDGIERQRQTEWQMR